MADIDDFPLAADGSNAPDGSFDGSDAGAAGPSNGGVVLSRGALVAIIVVVVVVAVVGSKAPHSPSPEETYSSPPQTARVRC